MNTHFWWEIFLKITHLEGRERDVRITLSWM